MKESFPKIKSILQLYELLPDHERILVDILRQVVKETLPAYCREKISYNVPFFYGNKSICLIWPSTVPRGGIKKGVMLSFWYGNRMKDADNYLTHGTNRQIFYKIYHSPEDIDIKAVIKLLKEAAALDACRKKRNGS
ncbi:MAG: DUF1801 domain-containing protein [Ferruginibacter sp.]